MGSAEETSGEQSVAQPEFLQLTEEAGHVSYSYSLIHKSYQLFLFLERSKKLNSLM